MSPYIFVHLSIYQEVRCYFSRIIGSLKGCIPAYAARLCVCTLLKFLCISELCLFSSNRCIPLYALTPQ